MNTTKITTIKTSRWNRQSKSVITLKELIEAVRHDTKDEDIQTFRHIISNRRLTDEDVMNLRNESIG